MLASGAMIVGAPAICRPPPCPSRRQQRGAQLRSTSWAAVQSRKAAGCGHGWSQIRHAGLARRTVMAGSSTPRDGPGDEDGNAAAASREQQQQPSSSDVQQQQQQGEKEVQPHQFQDDTLLGRIISAPLLLAATLGRTNDHYLAKRKRKRWWRQQGAKWPRVPSAPLAEQELPEPATELWAKLMPLALIFFCSTFNLTILQTLKDAIVVTAAGAEALPFLASFCVLPASIGFFFFYNRLVAVAPPRAVYAAAMAPLLAFYVLFALVLHPAHQSLHFHGLYEALAPALPVGLHGLLKVAENWTFSLFFCFAELWGAAVISVLFWTLANEVCTIEEAKTIYPLVGVAANLALVVAGSYTKFITRTVPDMGQGLQLLVGTVCGLALLMCGVKAWVDSRRWGEAVVAETGGVARKKKKKVKKGFRESLMALRQSPKILHLTMLVVSYGLSHRVFDVAWKSQLRVVYPTAQAYQGVLADVSIATGYLTMLLMVSGKLVFEYLGWSVAAAATPVVMLLSGGMFFGLSLAAMFGWTVPGVGPSGLALVGVTAGIITQVFARSSKFSLFDPAKEMVFIELGPDEKKEGKAAVDLLGSQVGKSGASWLTQALLLGLGSVSAAMPLLAATYMATIAVWLRAVGQLSGEITEQERASRKAAKEAKAAAKAAKAAAAAEGGSGPRQEEGGEERGVLLKPVPAAMSVGDSLETGSFEKVQLAADKGGDGSPPVGGGGSVANGSGGGGGNGNGGLPTGGGVGAAGGRPGAAGQ